MDRFKLLLEARNLSIGYSPNRPILQQLNFKLYAGDLICLMGSNGQGKSTLLKTILKLIPVIDGEILINQEKITTINQRKLSELVTVVFTSRPKVAHITAKELVSLGRYNRQNFLGKLSQKDDNFIEQIFADLAISNLINHPYLTLSDGQKQKVLVARAVAQDTPLILLDEPTVFLDIPSKLELFYLLHKMARERGKGILFTSHDWNFVLEMSSWCWLLDKEGKLHQGVPEDLILSSKISHIFHHDKYFFESTTATFKLQKQQLIPISLQIDNELIKNWTIHFLSKIGYQAVADDFFPKISYSADKWQIHFKPGKVKEASSLNQLMVLSMIEQS